MSAIDQISVRPSDDPAVQTIVRHFEDLGKDASVVEGGFHLRNASVKTGVTEDWTLGEGFVFVADPNANGRPGRQSKETHRTAH